MNTPPATGPKSDAFASQRLSHGLRIGIVSTQTSPPCPAARFSAELSDALGTRGCDANVIWMPGADVSSVDVAVIQHGDGIDGLTGDDVVHLLDGLHIPAIVVLHTIAENPTSQQHSSLSAIAAMADQLVVMTQAARQRLCHTYAVDRSKVTVIPHGAAVPAIPRARRPSRPTILTCGLLRPGLGVERVIDAMPLLDDVPGRPCYLVAGPTHPQALAAEGEAYREARVEQARRIGVADSVKFDSGYYDGSMLAALIQQSSVVVLPYDSTEQVTSGVLVDAIANGRPVVATAFPVASELLGGGAGVVVDHDDPEALASALRRIITQPRLAGAMAAEARACAPQLAWPVVAAAYVGLAQRVLADRRAPRPWAPARLPFG